MTDEIEDAHQRQIVEMAALSTLPVVTLTVLIFPNGAGAARSPGKGPWLLSFSCAGWRQDVGPVQREPLLVRQWVDDADLQPQMERYKAGAIVRLRVRLSKPAEARQMALLEGTEEFDVADDELLSLLDEFRVPVTHTDDLLGLLILDRSLDWYEGRAFLNGRDVCVYLSAQAPGDLEKSLTAAHCLWADQAAWQRRIQDAAVAELLAVKNTSWIGDGEVPVTAPEFIERMSLETIVIGPNGNFEFGYDDGELFWGHGIQVSGTLQHGPNRVDIVG